MKPTSYRPSIQSIRSLSRRHLLTIATTGGAAAFAAACGGGTKDGGKDAVREATIAPSARTAEASQPKSGGTLNVRLAGNAPLDPHQNTTFLAQTLASYTYARLLRIKTSPDPSFASNYELEGDLASGVESSADGLSVTFKLKPNAKFHDIAPVSGRVLDSEDIKLSVERFRTDPKNNNRSVLGSAQSPLVDAVETPDARTVVFKLAKPYGPFRNLMANSGYLWIMPKEVMQGKVDPAKQMIGAGPFVLESVQPDIAHRVKKNPAYFETGQPYVDGVNINVIPEEAQEVAQFQAGRLDAANIPAERVDEVKKSTPKASLLEYLPQTHPYLALQQRGASILKDERVRRAVQISIDRDALLSLIYGGKGVWNSSIPANFGQWRVDPKSADMGAGGQWYKTNPAEAKKLLAAAGYPNGAPIRFNFSNNAYGERFNQSAEAIAGMLKDGGFNVQIVILDYQREWIAPGTGAIFGTFEGIAYGQAAAYADPHDYFLNQYWSKSTRNTAGVQDPQLDAMIEKEEAALDDKERIKLVKDIQRYLAERVYYGHTSVGPAYIGVQEWLKNYQRTNGYGLGSETYARAWVDRG